MRDWVLSRIQLTSPHSNPNFCEVYFTHLRPSTGPSGRGCQDCSKGLFVCLILATEHLIVLLHDIVERGFVRVLVHHRQNNR
jgi:hypothetical protein